MDLDYTAGFYPETAPSWLAFAAAAAGRLPSPPPRRVIELGFGRGFGLALLAAANPDVQFEGYDISPAHVAFAQALGCGAELENLEVHARSFEALAAESHGSADADLVVAHGVMSWIPQAARAAVAQIAGTRLRPGGLLHLSYNSSPGAQPDQPLRDLFRAVAARTPGSPEAQAKAAVDLLRTLAAGGAGYIVHNPVVAEHVGRILQSDPVYLAHEYLGDHWQVFSIGDMAGLLEPQGLQFLCAAGPVDNIAACAAPVALQPLIADAPDPVWRESLRDLAANRAFRRDIFRKDGGDAPSSAEDALAGWRFTLTLPRQALSLTFAGPLGPLSGAPHLYEPLADRLAQGLVGYEALAALPAFEGVNAHLAECLSFLVQSGQAAAVPPGPDAPSAAAHRFNRMLAQRAEAGLYLKALASPVVRTGLPIGELGLLVLSAVLAGETEGVDRACVHVAGLLARQGKRSVDGVDLGDRPAERLRSGVQAALDLWLPVWRRLGVLGD